MIQRCVNLPSFLALTIATRWLFAGGFLAVVWPYLKRSAIIRLVALRPAQRLLCVRFNKRRQAYQEQNRQTIERPRKTFAEGEACCARRRVGVRGYAIVARLDDPAFGRPHSVGPAVD